MSANPLSPPLEKFDGEEFDLRFFGKVSLRNHFHVTPKTTKTQENHVQTFEFGSFTAFTPTH